MAAADNTSPPHAPSAPDAAIRRRFIVTGRVQGVGFRPFVYRTALERDVAGFVLNAPEGVIIEVQGAGEAVQGFGRDLQEKLPPLAQMVSCVEEDLVPEPQTNNPDRQFEIRASASGHGHNVLISPDTATCDDCLRELFDPADPRHLYPFINCTNCGPRYTITRSIPYDRPVTSMACFPLCERCDAEYRDPLDRRFHAQPNACPECGPHVWLADRNGEELCRDTEALRELARRLAGGAIAAIKGLGGFHLACDATNHDAVQELRRRKNRWDKPLAVMVPDLDAASAVAAPGGAERALLASIERPITLCPKLAGSPLSQSVSPDTDYVGAMLPYTPLHHVLLHLLRDEIPQGSPPALVMTSGNRSSEPISLGNRETLRRLAGIADVFLLHNRDILIRTDDSVVRAIPNTGRTQFLRRARGFTPAPVFLSRKLAPVLAVGPELKNTLCFIKGDQAFVSQHIGDMENLETFGFHQEIAEHLQKALQVEPVAVVRDLHPDYLSTRFAEELAERNGLKLLTLQHHYAHIHAVVAENRCDDPVLGLALDGTGYGEDGTIWGGEFLYVDPQTLEHRRLAHLTHIPLPGAETAIREPWRIAQGVLWEMGERDPQHADWPWLAEHADAARFLPQLLGKSINCPLTSSCGRLFDAASALLGLRPVISYEGQAAIVLEAAQRSDGHGNDRDPARAYPLPLDLSTSPATLNSLELLRHLMADRRADVPVPVIARRFHQGLARGLAETAVHFARETGVTTVALSGGAMLNMTLATELPHLLAERNLRVLTHTHLPPGDASISLGQAVWGSSKLLLSKRNA